MSDSKSIVDTYEHELKQIQKQARQIEEEFTDYKVMTAPQITERTKLYEFLGEIKEERDKDKVHMELMRDTFKKRIGGLEAE